LSAPIQSTKLRWIILDFKDIEASPFSMFYFNYRSKEALKQELIITRPRSLPVENLESLQSSSVRRLSHKRPSQ
ncbi:hypothetical protein FJTKL_07171, partial [Diaporthe vaccinii]